MSRRIVASMYVSLDGFIDEPGEWSLPFFSDQAGDLKSEELFKSDALLLGRLTYEGFARAWPSMTDVGDFAHRMNSIPKYVASRTLTQDDATWNATIMTGDVVDAVTELRFTDGGDLLIGGSGQLVDTLTNAGLIDEYKLMVHPIILGNGRKRLFANAQRITLEKTAITNLPNGVTVQHYVPLKG